MNGTVESATLATPPIRERLVLWGGIAAVTALAWIYLLRAPMPSMDAMAMATMPMAHHWSIGDASLTFIMWAIMMVAMMMPSATPMLSMYERVASTRENPRAHQVWVFAAGYVAVWTGFSLVATALQFALQESAIISEDLRATPIAAGIILVVAGIYQLTPVKNICLTRCRTPVGFLMLNWRDGSAGAFSMGLKHGALCMGCCWMLMALLFVAGVMNLAWVAAISALVLIEKAAPRGGTLAAVAGILMIAAGVVVAVR
jgi:predicted metal-binding membrane protein